MKAPKNNLCRAASFELRNQSDDGFTLEGYAAVFDSPTRIDSWEGRFDEVIARGAFAKTISERKPVMQFDHGHDIATGSVPIGAIQELREDAQGLFVSARLHDNQRVEPIRQAIASGAIDGMSFRFAVLRDEWNDDASLDAPLRTVREVALFELGPVVFPAYESTSVGIRSLLADLDEPQRRRLLAELMPEAYTLTPDLSDAARSGTSDEGTDAARSGTSVPTLNQRRASTLRRLTPTWRNHESEG
jgi:HK97 family phage prohead protease